MLTLYPWRTLHLSSSIGSICVSVRPSGLTTTHVDGFPSRQNDGGGKQMDVDDSRASLIIDTSTLSGWSITRRTRTAEPLMMTLISERQREKDFIMANKIFCFIFLHRGIFSRCVSIPYRCSRIPPQTVFRGQYKLSAVENCTSALFTIVSEARVNLDTVRKTAHI